MAKKPALKKKEDIGAVPMDQPVDIDLSDDPIVPVIDDDEGKKEEKKRPMNGTAVIAKEPERTQEDDERDALRKQVQELQAAETARNAEWERRMAEQAKRVQELERKTTDQEFSGLETRFEALKNGIEASEAEIAAASEIRKNAIQTGDWEAERDATRRMMRAEARLENYENQRGALEAEIETRKNAPPKKDEQQVPSDAFEAHIANVPEAGKTWLRSHREYVTSQRKNIKLQEAVLDAQEAGLQLYTPAFFEAVETSLGLRQAAKKDDDEVVVEERRTPVSAPVSRDPPSPSTGKAVSQRVTLSPEERDTAHKAMPNMEPGEAERIYAREKLKLLELKKNGHYTER